MKNNTPKTYTNYFKTFLVVLTSGMFACSAETTTGVEEEAIADNNEIVVDTWDRNEFESTFATNNYYEEWDANDDNMLDENEYYTGFYDTWDTNNHNRLDENEWNTSVNNFGLTNESWADWDTSGDGILDNNEFRTGLADYNYYTDWDVDSNNFLTEREYTDGIFGLWDTNDDDLLNDTEYGYYNTYYGV